MRAGSYEFSGIASHNWAHLKKLNFIVQFVK